VIYTQRSCKIRTTLSRKVCKSLPILKDKRKGNNCERYVFFILKEKDFLKLGKRLFERK